MKEFIVYTRRIAFELKKQGFKIIRTEVNPTHPQFECWIFEATPNFKTAFERLAKD